MSNKTVNNIFSLTGYIGLFILIFFVLLIIFVQRNSSRDYTPIMQERTVAYNSNNNSNMQQTQLKSPTIHDWTVSTLNIVARELRNKVDVNNDGKTNCIDAAVTFYKHFPDKTLVKMTLNVNNSTGLNHLFNSVLMGGVWIPIEPQAFYSGYSSYWLEDVWGRQYDSNKNTDATQQYIRYAR